MSRTIHGGDTLPIRFLVPIPGLTMQATREVAGVRLLDAPDVARVLESHLAELPGPFRELTQEAARSFRGTCCAELSAPDAVSAVSTVSDVLDLLRLFQQSVAMVETTVFGLPGDVGPARIEYIQLDGPYGVGWYRAGHAMGFTFTEGSFDTWKASIFAQLAERLRGEDESSEIRQLMTAVRLLSTAVVERRPDVKLLTTMIAAEALLGRGQTWELARRAAYFTCGRPNDRCGRDRDACVILQNRAADQRSRRRLKTLLAGALAGGTMCSAWVDFLERYEARSALAHGESDSVVTQEQASQALYWAIKFLLPDAMAWWLSHPTSGAGALDDEIDAVL